MVAGSFRLNFASESATIATDEDTFFIATALLFGPGPATLAIAAGGLVFCFGGACRARQIAFNTAALAVSMWVGSHAFFLAAGIAPLSQSQAVAGSAGPAAARDDGRLFRAELGADGDRRRPRHASVSDPDLAAAFPVALDQLPGGGVPGVLSHSPDPAGQP